MFQASNFSFESPEEWTAMLHNKPGGPPYQYSRLGNPTVNLVEQKIAKLERTEACKVTGCGQGAIATAILACTAAGSHVVCVDT
ncbi:PLP-dependent transferase, partial [Vibrio parahaemolyticus]